MMRTVALSVAMTGLVVMSGGCGEAGMTLDGRDVLAKSSPFHGTGVTSFDDESATFSLNSRVLRVTKNDVSASRHEAIALPAEWNQLELIERGAKIVILADGKHVGEL